jgi:hypothetical protein
MIRRQAHATFCTRRQLTLDKSRHFGSFLHHGLAIGSRIADPIGGGNRIFSVTHPKAMAFSVLRTAAALMSAAMIAALPTIALAQPPEGDAKPADANAAGERKIDDIAEAARLMTGPAANPECVWHGTRVVRLLWGEDIDTALRQLELYDRFKCPADHIQASFRCFIRLGPMDPKAADAVKTRARECWINPGSTSASPPATAATSAPIPTHPGTTNR